VHAAGRVRSAPREAGPAELAEADGDRTRRGAVNAAGRERSAPGEAGPAELAEADGNRTRPPGIARRTGFEDQEGHQSPFASHEGAKPSGACQRNHRWG
jgi:hypothetical protein